MSLSGEVSFDKDTDLHDAVDFNCREDRRLPIEALDCPVDSAASDGAHGRARSVPSPTDDAASGSYKSPEADLGTDDEGGDDVAFDMIMDRANRQLVDVQAQRYAHPLTNAGPPPSCRGYSVHFSPRTFPGKG